ncbi:hypothetical protein AruPA_13720 [Acidiphilium sp. PA]|uniref:hypothetical protein n=1 Tax=Acidiphilium sp. PA TaxID=2871705 RepID=UPI0022441CDF|nr:hypothetical protein [Acidiphilium sp. PA]MCW8308099.1 hypothetical protein [Acidiphilium sp. PA]
MTGRGEGRSSFFVKKEAKKLLFAGASAAKTPVHQITESFLLLFYKKEVLSLLSFIA